MREKNKQQQSTPEKNPFLNIEENEASSFRRGYIVTTSGVTVGLTNQNTDNNFSFVKLQPNDDIPGEWMPPQVCINIDSAPNQVCGPVLNDTGITGMFLTLPLDKFGLNSLPADGSTLHFTFPSSTSSINYSVSLNEISSELSPDEMFINYHGKKTFVNTGVHFFNGFDLLYDADGGWIAWRRK